MQFVVTSIKTTCYALCMLFFLFLLGSDLYATTNVTFKLEGKLTDSVSGLINGEKQIVFKLYSSVDNVSFWSETQTVTFQDGVFSSEIGIVTPLDDVISKMKIGGRLGIKVGSNEEVSLYLSSVPFSLHAQYADQAKGVDWSGVTNKPLELSGLTSKAGGDVSGNFSNLIVLKINGHVPGKLATANTIDLAKDTTGFLPLSKMSISSSVVTSNQNYAVTFNQTVAFKSKTLLTFQDLSGVGIGVINAQIVLVGNGVYTLPDAGANKGVVIVVKKIDASLKSTVKGISSPIQLIDGEGVYDLTVQYQSVSLVSNGQNWFIL